jgi:hypothetical protein
MRGFVAPNIPVPVDSRPLHGCVDVPGHLNGLFDLLGPIGPGSASAAWPSANRAIFVPFEVPVARRVYGLWCNNGGTANGNVDIGIYDLDGNRLVSTGSTAQTGTSVIQLISVTLNLSPGTYMIALALSSATGTTTRFSVPSVQAMQAHGVRTVDTAFPLPSTVTFVATSVPTAYIPAFGIQFSPVSP